MSTEVVRCPECGVDVGTTWRWCLACGYDPDGLAPVHARAAGPPVRSEPASWVPVMLCIVVLLVAAAFFVPPR